MPVTPLGRAQLSTRPIRTEFPAPSGLVRSRVIRRTYWPLKLHGNAWRAEQKPIWRRRTGLSATSKFSHRDARPHFELFALVSSARDTGSARTEAGMLVKHLRFWGEAVSALVDHKVVVDLTVIDDAALSERIRDTVQPQLPTLHF
jgi:hypothetical protein